MSRHWVRAAAVLVLCASAGSSFSAIAQERLPLRAAPPVNGMRVGLGVVVSGEGHILTSHHIVSTCESVRFARSSERPDIASVVAKDSNNDLALLKTRRQSMPAATFRIFPAVQPGEFVRYVAVGTEQSDLPTPLPLARALAISAVGPQKDTRLFAFSSRLIGDRKEPRPGDSGGAVLDDKGNVIGILTGVAPYDVKVGVGALQGAGFVLHSSSAVLFLQAHKVPIDLPGGIAGEELVADLLNGIVPSAGGGGAQQASAPSPHDFTVRLWCMGQN